MNPLRPARLRRQAPPPPARLAAREGVWTARDFRFHTGEALPELRLAYTALGDPAAPPVLLLHGTSGSARSLLTPGFAGKLFGPGQPLDAARHFLILPDATDAVVPMAAMPTEMSGRNWTLRRLMMETIRRDPAYAGGNCAEQPPPLRMASVFHATATNGGTINLQAAAPTREAADRLVDQRLAAPMAADANDFVRQWDASRDHNPEPLLDRVRARVLAINAADDERNPPETGLMQAALARIPGARLHLIPASAKTLGHGTTGQARFWREELRLFLGELG